MCLNLICACRRRCKLILFTVMIFFVVCIMLNYSSNLSLMKVNADNHQGWGRDLLNVTQCLTPATPVVIEEAIYLLLKDFKGLRSRVREPKAEDTWMINFLDNYKNPCWIEELPYKHYNYSKQHYVPYKKAPMQSRIRSTGTFMDPILKERQQNANGSAPYYNNGTRM